MKLQVYTALDKAVGAFLQPFFCRSRGEALRSFTDAVNDPKSQFYRHVSDFTMFYLGEFDDASGLFASSEPQRVISAVECVDNVASESAAPEYRSGNGSGVSAR